MSGVAIIRALLIAHKPVTDIVFASNIRAGILPQGSALPAVSVSSVSEIEEITTARNMPVKMIRERVQVTVYTSGDYPKMKALMKATSLGKGVFTGTVAGFRVRSVLPWSVGPEIPPADDNIFEQSRDFMVTFVEAN